MDEVRAIAAELSNWDRWGPADELGALNLVGPAEVVRAAGLVRTGEVFSLGIDLSPSGPLPSAAESSSDRRNPVHLMTEFGTTPRVSGDFRYTDDWIGMPTHSGTHWDALAHVVLDGTIYNGFPAAQHITPSGATRCAIDAAATGVVGRGVLLDVARHRGVEHLQGGEVISPEELDAVCEAQGAEIVPGDIVLLRTGWWEKYLRDGRRDEFWSAEPGPGVACARWFRHHDVAAVCADNFSVEAIEQTPSGWGSPEVPGEAFALHVLLTRDLGVLVGELFDLQALAAACATDGRWDFLFCAPPLRITGGIGSPINPLAIR